MTPTTLKKLQYTDPVLAAVVDPASTPVHEMHYYRIQFAVNTVKPKTLPPFTYVTSKVFFDCLLYTAIVEAAGLDAAITLIRKHWPDAQPRLAEENRSSFDAEDSSLPSVRFGAVHIPAKRSLFSVFKFWGKA